MKNHIKLLLALLALQCGMVFGQVATGSLGGTVTDANGAVIPDAKVTATAASTGVQIETVSSEAGLYVFPTLTPSVYTISVEKTGFKKLNRQNVEIRVAQRLDMNLQLEVGDVQQSIEVTADAPLLETSTSERGQNFSTKFMTDLPLFTGGIRNPRTFVSYLPGVNAGAEVSISGSGGRAQEVLIDGGSLTIPESGGTVFNMPSAEIFGEFKLLTGTYSAEYGRFGGGVEIYVTKSGGNRLHGTGFLNMRRQIWNANSWNNNSRGVAKPKERLNELGGAIGGPLTIPKVYNGENKTFWFFTYTKDLRPATISFPVMTVPTAAMKRGDFSELSQIIYDPATTNGNVRQPFPGNIIPADRFSTVAKNLIPLIPDPNNSQLANNYNFVNQSSLDRYIWSLKFDHAFTPLNRVSFWMSNESQVQSDTTGFPGPIGNGLGASTQKPYNYRVNHDWNLSPAFLMHTTVSKSATRQGWNNPAQAGFGTKLGIPGVSPEGDATPRIIFRGGAGYSPYGVQDGKVANGGQNNDTLMITQGYSWLKGKHEFKFGWDARWMETFGFDNFGTNGRYFFNRNQTAVIGSASGSGNEFASLLLGAVDEADRILPPVLFDPVKYRYLAGYFQDNWRIGQRLTLNLGLRYEVPIGWHIPNGFSSVDLAKANPAAGGRPGALQFAGQGAGRTGTTRFWDTDYTNIGPRLGFAYQASSKTVIRGGWGIFYQTLGNGGCGCREGFSNSNVVPSQGFAPAMNWDNPIPVVGGFRPPPVLDPSWGNFKNVDFMGPTFGKAPRVYNWSISVQQEIARFVFDVAYVGNRGYGLASTIEMNQLPMDRLALGSLLTAQLGSPQAIAAGFTEPFPGFGLNRTVAQSLRPYPQFFNVAGRNAGVGRTWYDSLQTKVERRYGGFQLMGSYTWSKSLALAHFRQIFSQTQTAPQDAYNINDSKSFLPFDQPHVFNLLLSYDLPFGRGKRFLGSSNHFVNAAVGGWTISSAQRYYSGNLIQVVTPGNPLGSTIFAANTKAIRNSGIPIRTGTTELDPNDPSLRYFNAGAFSPAAAFTPGTAAYFYDDFRQPNVYFENVSLAKRTTLWENDKNPIVLTYRADAFNIFNRTRFGGVNGTIGNPNFGRASGPQVGARAITMGLRLDF